MYDYYKMPGEIWEDVPERFNRGRRKYRVSNLGRVFILPENKVTWCKREVSLNGKQILVSHLVLEVFDRPRKGKEKCIHMNGDTTDNSIDNLTWDSVGPRLTSEDVREIESLYDKGWSQKRLKEKFGVHRFTIEAIISAYERITK